MANATINAIKKDIFKTYGGSETNTGSIEAQIALLTERILHISKHLKSGNAHDHSSNRSLVIMVGRRKKLLAYLQRKNLQGYRELIAKLGLRK